MILVTCTLENHNDMHNYTFEILINECANNLSKRTVTIKANLFTRVDVCQSILKYRRLYELRSKYLSPPLLSSATTVLLCVEESVNISISETYLHGRFMKYNVMLQDNNKNNRNQSFR